MRFGYCINMLAAPGSDGSGREAVAMLAGLGFDYLELPMAQMMAYEPGDFKKRFLEPMQASGLSCRCCNNFLPAAVRLTGPDADLPAALRYAARAMERAAMLGAEKIVFGSSGARNVPLGFSRDEAMDQIRAFLTELAPLARRFGITLVLEHLNRGESNLINSLAEGITLRRELNLPQVENLLDTYHLNLSGGSEEDIREAGGHLRHVHIARTLGRSLPAKGDECGWPALFSLFREIGYDGDISIEAYAPADDRPARIRESLEFLRSAASGCPD